MKETKIYKIKNLLSKIIVRASCWEWQGSLTHNGYAQATFNGRVVRVHRLMYELFKGNIESGRVVHHKCNNRRCVNPQHLEVTTNYENQLLSHNTLTTINKKKTCCRLGHIYNKENTYYRKDGSRKCKLCNKTRWRK